MVGILLFIISKCLWLRIVKYFDVWKFPEFLRNKDFVFYTALVPSSSIINPKFHCRPMIVEIDAVFRIALS